MPAPPFKLTNAPPMVTPTYDGSGQVVHPDVLIFPQRFRGYKYVLCYDPYPNGDNAYENPSIYVSNKKDGNFTDIIDGQTIPNPISGLPESGWFNSDSDMMFWKGKIWLYWRHGPTTDYYRELMLRRSADLINWDEKKVIMTYNSEGATRYCSPAFVPENDNLVSVFFPNATDYSLHLFETTDGENLVHIGKTNFSLPLGRNLWHIDVNKLTNGEYWALACDTDGELWFARSKNRIDWEQFDEPVLSPRAGEWDAHIYRTTFAVLNQKILVWYSAHNPSPAVWHCGYTETDISSLVDPNVQSSNVIGRPVAEIQNLERDGL